MVGPGGPTPAGGNERQAGKKGFGMGTGAGGVTALAGTGETKV